MTRTRKLLGQVMTMAAISMATVAIAALVVFPRVTGGAALTVLTGSMAPTYPAGSVVLVAPVDTDEIVAGDVITFQSAPGVAEFITHRVVRVQDDTTPRSFITKGDANDIEDTDPVPAGAVHGTVRFHLPYVGHVADFLRTPIGWLTLGGPVLLFVVFSQIRSIRRELRRSAVDTRETPETLDTKETTRV